MLKGRGRDPRVAPHPAPAHLTVRAPTQARQPAHSPTHLSIRTPTLPRAPLAKPEPDYEVVEFPTDQYVNAKLQPPPPPPPRPPTGHPAEAASCGLCGGGGARVRCTECGRRALCASCDDMYHRHPKRRHHQRQALSLNQMRDERPPLPPKGTPPVPPPRRHKMSGDRMSASPRPPSAADQRNSSLASHPTMHTQTMPNSRMGQNVQQIPAHLQKLTQAVPGGHLSSMPYLPTSAHHAAMAPTQVNTMGHMSSGWQRPRNSLPGFNMPPNVQMAPEAWEAPENMVSQSWGRPLRRGASVLELGMSGVGAGVGVGAACAGCGQCAGGWRYGSCASLDHQAWPAPAWPPPPCCHPPHPHAHAHPAAHVHAPYTPQPYRRADSRAASRVASRAGSRAASPAVSVRSRASRRTKHRTPSPPPLPSSDADSESESESDHPPPKEKPPSLPLANTNKPKVTEEWEDPPPAPAPARGPWQCEHCTFVNEAGVRVCAVCCRTPTAAPRELPADHTPDVGADRPSVAESVRSVAESARGIERLDLSDAASSPPPAQAQPRPRQNGETTKATTKKERVSTSCGPSPPREESVRKQNNRLVTPTREQSVESTRTRHDMAVGASPPREVQNRTSVARSPPRQTLARASPYREPEKPTRHSISVGPSPPRESSIRPSTVQKKSAGTSPPREREIENRSSSSMIRTNVSNTGTSPPPQSISTQTYEVPNTWERAPSAARGRARRRLRDDSRRERSHSRHSLSSDTRESERSARTSGGGGGRWEWREGRDSSPGGEWSGSERRPPPRLARRASHLDLRRERQPPARRSSFYRSEAASPEPTRAMSLEALATATGANAAAATRGLELARLMAEAERLGFSAAEVQAALAQSPAAPLSWLRSRWPSLCAGVRAAAARLAPHARVSELEARAALARHRGAMWPAVTDCVERHRRQTEKESGTRQHGGRVWGSPAGADDDAAPPRGLREDSSDEFEAPPPADLRDDDWMYLPLDGLGSRRESVPVDDWDERPADLGYREVASDVALELSRLLVQAGVPATNDDLILNSLLSNAPMFPTEELGNVGSKPNSIDFIQSENDFIDAYNALTRSTPLPVVDDQLKGTQALSDKDPKRDMYDVSENYSHLNIEIATANASNNKLIIHTPELVMDSTTKQTNVSQDNQLKVRSITNSPPKQEEALISSTKIKSMPAKEEITNVTKQHSNTEIIPKEDNLTRNNIHQPLIDNFEESLPNESTISAQVEQNLNQIVENIPETEQNVNQAGFEKTNLNDIVGNTQKLIQQMRDEINSDINYIDSKNASQSELESSSNESDISSEHESSYSDTEDKETDELSSNESESSDTDSEKEHSNKRRPTIIHRTSSEENDQFEEAMDHIEDQIEDFKNTNIEILDSIARSLQEEHSISVQVNEPRSIINDKRQDLNNNMFVEVNSFEEIYAQLNTNKNEITNQERVTNHNSTIGSPNKTDMNVTRQQGTVATFNSNSQIQETISKDSHNILYNTNVNRQRDLVHSSEQNVPEEMETNSSKNSANAQNNLDTKDVVSNSSDVEDSLDSADSDITTTEQDNPLNNITASLTESINIQHIEENSAIEDSTSEYIIIEDTIERSTMLESTEEKMAADNITQIILTDERFDHNIATEDNTEQKIIKVSRSQADLTEETVAMETTQNILIENSNEHDNTIQNIVEERNLSEERAPERTTTEIDIDQTATANNITEQIVNSNEQKVLTEDIIEQNIATENTTDQRTIADNNQERIDINNTNTTAIHSIENEAVINATEERKRSPTKSPPNSPTDAGTNKAFTINKSNIPKLVKVVQNNKQKGDKTSPKVIASKVPVRRASLKQYPAPTPPKTHFGNVQSGHVKQLQTRLFNNKFPKTVVNVPDVIDVKPSTSTIHKKKPAPPPPTTSAAQKQPVLEKPSPPKEKKNSFFRESCRTEDEWTESETEDAPLPAPRKSEEPQRPLSPPPPVTLRRVSGQIIDLARVRLPEGSPERQARMLLAEGATETWEQARLAVELVSRGAEPPAALLAALECADLPAALAYLHQDCELCASRLPEHEMVSMLRCTHRCCRECARLYFTVQITERSIADCVCPYCKEPDLENTPEDAWLEYFAHLDILLKTLLETDVHELFQRKLRDRTLALDPNFRWCMECSSGFFVHPKQKKIRCPECRSVSCAKCRKTWSANHEGLSCEQYAAWLDDNDPERSLAAVQQHLRDNGLECPRCRFKYSLSRGGCMHFTCTQCKYEFCYGCGKPFMMGARCGLSEYCARLGLHAHHPRNCLFYLRDKEPHELQTLLQMNNVEYETATPEGSGNRCPIQLQRETPTGLVDGTCGSEAPPNYAGLCKPHYVEYLAARARSLDPIPIMDVSELVAELRRRALPLPERGPWDTDPIYAGMCAEIVKEKIPLD